MEAQSKTRDLARPVESFRRGAPTSSSILSSLYIASFGMVGSIASHDSQDPKDAQCETIQFLAKGGEGDCNLITCNGVLVVRKTVLNPRERQYFDPGDDTPREVRILRDMLPKNERIINLLCHNEVPGTLDLYYEYYSGGDLECFIHKYLSIEKDVPEAFIWHVYLQCLEALAYLHFGYDRHSMSPCEKSRSFRPIIHRDIKPENILLRLPLRGHQVSGNDREHPYPSIVLADFGLSVLEHDGWHVGTDIWQPPETPFHSTKSDVWSVGAVVHALAAQGQSPVAPLPDHLENNSANQTWWNRQPEARQPYTYFTSYSYKLAEAMHLAFARDPIRRPTSLEILLRVERELEDPNFPLRTPRKPLDECIFSEDWPTWM